MSIITTYSPEGTLDLGARIGAALRPGDVVALTGELGAGKTMITKGIAKGLGIPDYEYVNSPSFTLMKEYSGPIPLYHFDIYRLEGKAFSETLEHDSYFYGAGVAVVEWADKIIELIPDERLEINITYGEGDERRFEFVPRGKRFEDVVKELDIHRVD
ncbi:MAG: tRNA (adenosine(37)-N6)-threonylcarbamoyltransferase complex ATPase subunit type 1 TsaE [Candidatus Omnitrophica bacterium]|nr:tRNA (adenosine(37)-N6)-threonylcarbamoyltransferase complex ATPase subunit type 1 TsaE [Candidatus Omnitrophota bacterium]